AAYAVIPVDVAAVGAGQATVVVKSIFEDQTLTPSAPQIVCTYKSYGVVTDKPVATANGLLVVPEAIGVAFTPASLATTTHSYSSAFGIAFQLMLAEYPEGTTVIPAGAEHSGGKKEKVNPLVGIVEPL